MDHEIKAGGREPFGGRYFGIWNVEGEGEPVVILPGREDADRELARRRALPEDDDDHLTEYHQVFPCNFVGVWWNSYEPDPREHNPLTVPEIIAAYNGDT
jgi:hypothetical protein